VESLIEKSVEIAGRGGGRSKEQVDYWKTRLWSCVANNKGISSEFILKHLNNGNIKDWSLSLFTLILHPSFETLWETYLSFFNQDIIDRVFEYPGARYLGEQFFLRFPQFLKHHLAKAKVSVKFLTSVYNQNDGGQSGDYLKKIFFTKYRNVPIENRKHYTFNKYGIFENINVGEQFIETLLNENKEKINESIIRTLNTNTSLSEEFWERHQEWIHWGTEDYFYSCGELEDSDDVSRDFAFENCVKSTISRNPNLSIQFIKKYKDRLNLAYVLKYNNQLPNYFFRQALVNFLKSCAENF
jgi:hypothetical protein